MPVYEYRCDQCDREVTLTLSIREHEKGEVKCPRCGGESLRPLLSAFMSQTSKKSLARRSISKIPARSLK
jgi:putative FmdB family regulatory protein